LLYYRGKVPNSSKVNSPPLNKGLEICHRAMIHAKTLAQNPKQALSKNIVGTILKAAENSHSICKVYLY
jgi:hypothetical protein